MRLCIALLVVCVLSCSNDKKQEIKINKRLVSFNDNFAMEIDSLLLLDSSFRKGVYSNEFYEKTDSIIYRPNEIYISYLAIVNACAYYTGNFLCNGDTLKLQLIDTGDIACASQRCDRVTFTIKNPDNKKYIIRK